MMIHRLVVQTSKKSFWYYFYRPQRICGKIMFSHASVILFTGMGGGGGVSVPAWPRGHITRGVSVQGGLRPLVFVQRNLYPGGSLSREGGLYLRGLCPGGLCPGGSLSRGVSVWGVSVRETPHMVRGRYASYWNAFLFVI